MTTQGSGGSVYCGQFWGGSASCSENVGPPDWSHGDHPQTDRYAEKAADPTCPPELLERMLLSPAWGAPVIQNRVARNPNLGAAAIETAMRRGIDSTVYQQLLHHPNVPVSVVQQLYNADNRSEIERSLISRPDCPSQWLVARAHDVTLGPLVATHPNATQEVWLAIATSTHTPSHLALITGIAETADSDLVARTDLPLDILRLLMRSRSREVRRLVMQVMPSQALPDPAKMTIQELEAATTRSDCPAATLAYAAQHADYRIRRNAAAHLSTPVYAIATLADDWVPEVQEKVATHPACPIETLRSLAKYGGRIVRERVAGNPGCPSTLQLDIWRASNIQTRVALAGNLSLSPEVMALLIDDPNSNIWQALKSNPALPDHVRTIVILGGRT